MRNIASIVLVWAFIASIALLPISRLPELSAYAPMLPIAHGQAPETNAAQSDGTGIGPATLPAARRARSQAGLRAGYAKHRKLED